jgi:hypothetical protein
MGLEGGPRSRELDGVVMKREREREGEKRIEKEMEGDVDRLAWL